MAIDLAEVTGQKLAQAKKKEEAPKIASGLDKDAFMKLFLEQLKNQDPTAPMETDKIITQTAQLTQVEMQEENKKTMKEVAEAMKSTKSTNDKLIDFQKDMKSSLESLNTGIQENTKTTSQVTNMNALNTVSMIGKIVETDVLGINLKDKAGVSFDLFFDEKIDTTKGEPKIEIFDQNKELVKTIDLKDKNAKGGFINFSWDGKDNKGNQAKSGSYEVIASYNLDSNTNQYAQTRVGRGEVQSIIFDNGMPLMRIGDMILPMSSALEFYSKQDGHKVKSIEEIKKDAKTSQLFAPKEEAKVESKEEVKNIKPEDSKDLASKMLDAALKGKQLDLSNENLQKLASKPEDLNKQDLNKEDSSKVGSNQINKESFEDKEKPLENISKAKDVSKVEDASKAPTSSIASAINNNLKEEMAKEINKAPLESNSTLSSSFGKGQPFPEPKASPNINPLATALNASA